MKLIKILKKSIKILFVFALFVFFVGALMNLTVIISSCGEIIKFDEACEGDYDHIVVLGAGINSDGTMSNVLTDRVTYGAELILRDAADKIIVSGDGSGKYDESAKMREYMLSRGVDEEKIIKDGYGYNTYDTMWRAKNVYGAEKIIIVTQDFHMYRAIFIAKSIGLDCVGVVSDTPHRATNVGYEIRETCARCKYCFDALFPHKATETEL